MIRSSSRLASWSNNSPPWGIVSDHVDQHRPGPVLLVVVHSGGPPFARRWRSAAAAAAMVLGQGADACVPERLLEPEGSRRLPGRHPGSRQDGESPRMSVDGSTSGARKTYTRRKVR